MTLLLAPFTARGDASRPTTGPCDALPDGADLGPGTPIDGLPRAVAFTAPVEDYARCSLLLLPDRSSWKETCGTIDGAAPFSALIQIDQTKPALHEISVSAAGSITAARPLKAMSPSIGCSIESANDLVRAIDPASIVLGIGCIDDEASLTARSMLTQAGPLTGRSGPRCETSVTSGRSPTTPPASTTPSRSQSCRSPHHPLGGEVCARGESAGQELCI